MPKFRRGWGWNRGGKAPPAAPLSPPVNQVAPVISGNLQVGDTLSSTTGIWSGNPTPTYAYQWKRGVTNIGTDSPNYTLVEADAGQNITCEVTATNSQGNATQASNILVPNALAAPAFTVNPTITGSGSANTVHTLTSLGTVTGNPTPSLDTGQWQLDNVDVPGETASTYTPVADGSLTNEVTATNSQGSTAQDSNAITITGAGGLAVSNQTPDFGLNTRVGEGAWIPVSTGGTITSAVIDSQTNAGEFTINSDGSLEPLGALVAGSSTVQCTYNGSVTATHTVGKIADSWTVGTGELGPLVTATADTTMDGKTIYIREDTQPIGAATGDQYTFANSKQYPAGLTIKPHDVTRPGILRRMTFNGLTGTSYIFEDCVIHDEFDVGTDILGNTPILLVGGNDPDWTFRRCTISSNDAAQHTILHSGTGVFSGDGVGGGDDSILDFSSATPVPDFSTLDPTLGVRVRLANAREEFYRVTAFDNVLKTLTIKVDGTGPALLSHASAGNVAFEVLLEQQKYADMNNGVYSGDGVGGGPTTTLHFENVVPIPDFSNIAVNSAMICLETHNFNGTGTQFLITGFDNVAHTLTINATSQGVGNPAPTLLAANNVAYCIGDIHALRGMTQVGNSSTKVNTILEDNTFTDLFTAMALSRNGSVKIARNTIERLSGDYIKLVVYGDEPSIDIFNNTFGDHFGLAFDGQNPHADGIQFLGLTQHTVDNTVAWNIKGNRLLPTGGGRTSAVTALFMESMGAGRKCLVEVAHNVGVTVSGNALTQEQIADDSRVFNNTMLMDQAYFYGDVLAGNFVPGIHTESGGDSNDTDKVFVMNNATGYLEVGVSATNGNNQFFGSTTVLNTNAIYDPFFDGSNFESTDFTDRADAIARLTQTTAGGLDPANRPVIGALEYWDYNSLDISTASTSPADATGFTALAPGDVAAATANTLIESSAMVISGAPAQGVMIWAIGDGNPQLRLDTAGDVELLPWAAASEPIVAHNGEKVYLGLTSSTTPLADQVATLHAGARSVTPVTWTVTTEAGAFSAVAVDNQNAAYAIDTSFSGGAASDLGTVSMWIKQPVLAAATLLFERNGSNERFKMSLLSDGRLVITGRNSSGTVILAKTTTNPIITANTWHHIIFAHSLVSGSEVTHLYVDGSAVTAFSTNTENAGPIDAINQVAVFADTAGGGLFDGDMAEVFIERGVFHDPSNAPTLANFISAGKPVDLTGLGTPQLLLNESVANWQNNTGGTGGALTETGGTFVAASTSPSD